jgi:hypothetical protein
LTFRSQIQTASQTTDNSSTLSFKNYQKQETADAAPVRIAYLSTDKKEPK